MNKVTYQDILDDKYAKLLKQKMVSKRDTLGLEQMKLFEKSKEEYFELTPFDIPRMVKIPKNNGKMRDIFIYEEQTSLMLKIIAEVLTDKFNSQIHPSVFSYQKGKSILTAIKSVQKDMRKGVVFGKVDITNYFIEIDQEKINKLIERCFEKGKVGSTMHDMFNQNLYTHKREIIRGKLGIMPGNPISCVFSNLILKDLDKRMHDECISYTRYSDDIVIGATTEKELKGKLELLATLLEEYGLEINPNKVDYYGSRDVHFLGLVVNPDKIDITKSKFNTIKRHIKINARKMRKEVELGKISKTDAVKKMIRMFNKGMYKPIVYDDLHIGLGGFIFANVTTMETLREIDFYFINQCRYVVTGKHNKANCKTVQFSELEEMGFKSMCELFKLYKIGKEVYINEVYHLA